MNKAKRAVILLSGGLDSATTLAIARSEGFECHTLSFDYGQRHRAELDAAERVAKLLGAADHRVIRVDLGSIGGSALTDMSIAVPESADLAKPAPDIPITYVPARNTVFLALGLGLAEVLDAADLFIGVNAVDFSGYPDCRPEFIEMFERLANLATKAGVEGKSKFRVHAPLIRMTKIDIVRCGLGLGVDYSETVSCYQADAQGAACGRCDSCRLRRAAFVDSGIPDPTRYQPR